MKITQYFIDRIKLTNLSLLFIALVGIITMLSLPRQDSPNVDFNILTINTYYPGASPEDVEINVTDPIEDELEQVDGIEEFTSYSLEGMSYILIQLDPDENDKVSVKDEIRSAVDRVSNLPFEVEDRPVINEMKSTDFPVLEVAISGDIENEQMLRNVVKDFESELKALGEVGTIEKINYRKKEVKVLCDSLKMEDTNISFSDVLRAVRARNVKVSGGTLESFVDQKKIVTFSEFEELKDVKDVIIRSNFSGNHVKVKDIADIEVGFKKRNIMCRSNGINSINLIIKRRGTTDVIKLSSKIDSVIRKFQQNYKSQNISIKKIVDYSYYTRSLLNIVLKNAFIGFILVVLSLFVFLNFYTAFWVAVGIPISILGAYALFPFFDITTNQISLITMIMVLGMLVDDAIVIAENINRHQEDGMEPVKAAAKGTKEVFLPVLATIITTILCFVPMYFMTGILGKFIRAIPTVIILTLLVSLFESITMLPAHLSRVKQRVKGSFKGHLIHKLRFVYGRFLYLCLNNKLKSLFVFILICVFSISFFYKHSTFNLFPTEDLDLFYIVMETKASNSLEQTSKEVLKVEQVVETIPDNLMMGFKTIIGDHRTDEAASDPTLHENWALISIFLHPSSKRNKRSEDIIKELNFKVKNFKNFKNFEKLEIREIKDGPPVGEAITIRIISDDFFQCEENEKLVLDFLHNLNGVHGIDSSNAKGKEEVRLLLNYDYMAKVGVTAIDIANAIRIAYDGRIATTIRRDGEEISFRVQLKASQRGDKTILPELQVPNNQNKLIKIKNLVKLEYGKTPQSITHFNGKKAITITAKVKQDIITSKIANEVIKKKFKDSIESIPGVDIVFGGEEKATMESMENFMYAFICAIIAIYFVLVLLLNSYFQPFLIMVSIPFGFIGVLFAFHLHGFPMSFIGMIGSLGMMGVVVNDSLVMVTYLNSLRDSHHVIDIDLIVEGAKTRLRPVLLTTITTVLGLLPTVYGWGGTEPFLVPMVLALSWGLMFATVITLVLIPLLYYWQIPVNKRLVNLK